MSETAVKPGRPQVFDRDQVMDIICNLVTDGHNLPKICRRDDLPNRETIYQWMKEDAQLANKYAQARERRADARSDRIDYYKRLSLTGKIDPNTARVIIDAEKWQAGKENAKRYGDRQIIEHEVGSNLAELMDLAKERRMKAITGKQESLGVSLGASQVIEAEEVE
jgi:hypothetical protein